MKILILGSGGREHALAWKIKQSPKCENIYIAPGNAGTAEIAENINIAATDFDALAAFCMENKIGMIIVGPEDPLVKGVRDYFKNHSQLKNVYIIGPEAAGAKLEGSKDFSKNFMNKYGVPTAKAFSVSASDLEEGKKYIQSMQLPVVLKADGLAAGKGVLICESYDEAIKELDEMILSKKFGESSAVVLIEEFLKGIEVSVFVLTDGKEYYILPEAKDYKRIGENDTGLNTGGMGAISPVPFYDEAFAEKVKLNIIEPTLKGIQNEGMDYQGFIFIGLMNVAGTPYVIEYNVRMGDPETEAVMLRIESDLLDHFIAVAENTISNSPMKISSQTAAVVVTVSGGYPGSFPKGFPIQLPKVNEGSMIFHAGTSRNSEQELITNGGRVFAVGSLGENIRDAVNLSLSIAGNIQYENIYFRKDIGRDLIA